jgi:mRNA interferase HigB
VHVISKSAWQKAVAIDHTLNASLAEWHKVAQNAAWKNLVDVRRTYPHADFVAPFTVFNIKGNAYRLIVKIEYRWQIVFVKHLLTHEEYARGGWKK